MADIFDIDEARERKSHVIKEAKVRKIRKAFKAVRESWQEEGSKAGKLKEIFRKKNKGRKK